MPSHPDRVRRNYPVEHRPFGVSGNLTPLWEEAFARALADREEKAIEAPLVLKRTRPEWRDSGMYQKYADVPRHYGVGLALDDAGNVYEQALIETAKAIDATMIEPTPDTPWGV